MSDTLTITGVCNEISERSGWTTFHIDTGSQWPTKLATKKQEIIDAARAAGGELATWTYNEVESDKINEHTNKPFVNRYLERVDVGGTMPEQAAAPSTTPRPVTQTAPSAPTRAPLASGDKDRAITRMAVLKAAAEIVAAQISPGMEGPEFDPVATTIAAAARFETWVMRDVDDIPF